jgi:hypothetical protein
VTSIFNPLNAELKPICHLLALLGTHHILHISRIRVNPATGLNGRYFLPVRTDVITEASHIISCAAAGTNHKMVTSLSSDPNVISMDFGNKGLWHHKQLDGQAQVYFS